MPKTGKGAVSMPAGFLRPRLGLPDVLVYLWRSKWLMIAVALPLLAAGLAGAALLPVRYTAEARLVVLTERQGQVAAEVELLRSPAVLAQALQAVTLARAYPEIAAVCRAETCEASGRAAIAGALKVHGQPGSPVITATFRHRQADVSAAVLNALIAAYLDYRQDVFGSAEPGVEADGTARLQQELTEAEEAIRAFLDGKRQADLLVERETLQQKFGAATTELLSVQTRLRLSEAQLSDAEAQLRRIDPEITVYEANTSSRMLENLLRERKEKLSGNPPNWRAIQDLDRRIAQAEAQLDTGEAAGEGRTRQPNPAYQQTAAAIAVLRTELRALRGQERRLAEQISAIESRQRELISFSGDLQQLERRRDAAAAALRDHASGNRKDRLYSDFHQTHDNAIRVVQSAGVPAHRESSRRPAALLAILLAGLVALLTGLIRAYTRPGFSTPDAVHRTLGLPVVAAVRAG